MQRICKSLRTVSEAEVVKVDACTTVLNKATSGSSLPTGHSESSSHCDQPVTEKAFQDLSLVDKQGDTAEQVRSNYNFYLNILHSMESGHLELGLHGGRISNL
jgi:hypothetical protein